MTWILPVEDAHDLALSVRPELEGLGYQVAYAGDGLQPQDGFEREFRLGRPLDL